MSSFLDSLNLKPNERRLVVGVGVVLFIVVNVWFVWPHFGAWGKTKDSMGKANADKETFQTANAKIPEHKATLSELESKGSEVPPHEMASVLDRTIRTKAGAAGVNITDLKPGQARSGGKTNEFFEEKSVRISYNAGAQELVNFLAELSSGDSIIRVRDIDLKPDQTQTRLQGSMVLVASYQKADKAKK